MRQLNATGLQLIKQSEGLRLTAYKDIRGIWTIGFGHTGPEVVASMTISLEQALELLENDISVAITAILDFVKVPLADNQLAALVDFTFNLGVGALKSSTLLRLLNMSDYIGASKQFIRWDKAEINGQLLEVEGLKNRREREVVLWNTPDPIIQN